MKRAKKTTVNSKGRFNKKKRFGKHGEDLIIKVPMGTVIIDEETGLVMKDLIEDGEAFVAAKGGKGGKGNTNFKNSVRQAPNFAEAGGFEMCIRDRDGTVPGWMLIVILAREFAIAGMRTVAASDGTVIAAGMSGKIKTVLQMIAVPLLLLTAAIDNLDVFYYFNLAGQIFLWASLIMTVYSGVEYIVKNKNVFAQ